MYIYVDVYQYQLLILNNEYFYTQDDLRRE